MALLEHLKHEFKTDVTWNRVAVLGAQGARALPSASVRYVVEKFPIIGWLPRYNPRWIVNDVVAGLTLGFMLIPQGLAYAKIATIPVQYGLMSSWLPAVIYAFMGTSKDLSTGPTSLIGLLTADIVKDLTKEGHTPQEIASAVAMMMGIYGMGLGFLKLGFLLEFISVPIVSGFISAVAITIGLGQVASLLGEPSVSGSTAQIIHGIFANLPSARGDTAAIGFAGIILLTALQYAGTKWGNKSTAIWFLSITRAFITLLLFTGISYGVNKDRGSSKNFLWAVAAVKSDGIESPKLVSSTLLGKVVSRSIAPFVAAALEHTTIARGFGARNNYVTDQSQELCYFGLTNFFNSFFSAMGVGGAMSRTAVNSACKVRSPLSGLVTTAVVLVSIYKLTGALYWIPKATLSAIIITAVWPLIGSPKTYYDYWRTSLADFIASMIAFWVSLFVTTEIGIGSAVAFSIVYVLLRQVYKHVTSVGADGSELVASIDAARGMPPHIPNDVRIFRFNESFFFPNAHRVKTSIFDIIQTHHAATYSTLNGEEANRNWSVVGEKRVAALRKKANIQGSLPLIRIVILDFGKVNHLDTTALSKLRDFITELKKYAGETVAVRFVALAHHVRARFERGGWVLVESDSMLDAEKSTTVRIYRTVADAVLMPTHAEMSEVAADTDEKARVIHLEEV